MESYGEKIWNELFSSQEWGRYPSEEAIRFFLRSKNKLKMEKIKALDLGCGQGAVSWFMAREGAAVTAMDGAPAGLDRVKALAAEFGVRSGIETVLGEITEPGKSLESKYDIVLDHYSLFQNKEERMVSAYKGLFELLNKGGFLLTCVFGQNTSSFGHGKKISEKTYTDITKGSFVNRGLTTFFKREQLDEIFLGIGFEIEYRERILLERDDVVDEKLVTCLRKPQGQKLGAL